MFVNSYEVFQEDDLSVVFERVIHYMNLSYASDAQGVRIYLTNRTAYHYLETWTRGWARRAGKYGVWKDSQGNKMISNSMGA